MYSLEIDNLLKSVAIKLRNFSSVLISFVRGLENGTLKTSSIMPFFNKKILSAKKIASSIYMSLMCGKKLLISGERNSKKIKDVIIENLEREDLFKIDYISIANLNSLVEIKNEIKNDVLVSIAVIFKKTVRLIDNFHFSIN